MKISSKAAKDLLSLPNVVGFYTGRQFRNGQYCGTGLTVAVKKKVSSECLKASEMIPKKIEGHDTDVVEVGDIKALSRTTRNRPFRMGDSIGVYSITAGTAGWIVDKNNEKMILSNNHVFADVNSANPGDPIIQQGAYDGGTVDNCKVGTLHSFVKILFQNDTCVISKAISKFLNLCAKALGSSVTFSYNSSDLKAVMNTVDCALCKLDSRDLASSEVFELGSCMDGSLSIVGLLFAGSDQVTIANKIQNVALNLDVTVPNTAIAQMGDIVHKSGRTTGVTQGEVIAIDYTGSVDMGEKGTAIFTDQLLIGTPGFSAGGDSGSAIVRKSV